MIDKRTWKEFQDTKLLWWINRILCTFGWAIVVELDGEFLSAYPARVKYRGFDEKSESDGFIGLSEYLEDNISQLSQECRE